MLDGCASSARGCADIPVIPATRLFSCQAERNVLHLFYRCADQRETRLPGYDEAVQPSAAVGDVPSRVRRLVRWKKVRWRKLIADHLSLAVPIGEIAASARLMANALVGWSANGATKA